MHLSTTLRLSLSLTMLTVGLLLFAELLGLVPGNDALLESRRKVSESLAVQLSIAASRSDRALVQGTIDAFVERSPEVLSAAVRRWNGRVFSQTGEHRKHWPTRQPERSTLTHVLVPVYAGKERWGTIEVVFASRPAGLLAWLRSGVWGLVLFAAFGGGTAYYFLLRRTLRELDPRGTVPQRVRLAFDTLAEGALILDNKGQIVMANAAFAERSGRDAESLIGLRAAELEWRDDDGARPPVLPWEQSLKGGKQMRVPLRLSASGDGTLAFVVNSAPVLDDGGRARGALVTFNDVTSLEKTNQELERTVARLRESEREIKRKNEELHYLATRDPLTDSLNRRAFFSAFESMFRQVRDEGFDLSCLMVDIDHFKSVNDTYGHDMGDKVIRWVANVIRSHATEADLVCRYGGEEFSVVLHRHGVTEAVALAQRIREEVEKESGPCFGPGLSLTISTGVSSVHFGPSGPEEMLIQADQALYIAKETGRNQVVLWSPDSARTTPSPAVARRSVRPSGRH